MKDPEKMNETEIRGALAKLEAYEEKYNCEAVMVEIQNFQLGALYRIMPAEMANKRMKNHKGPEIYLEIFTKDYFYNKVRNSDT